MAIISESDLNELRAFQRELMESSCVIRRPDQADEKVLDENTGEYGEPTYTVVYEGVCRVSTTRGGTPISVGHEVVMWQSTDIYVPYDAPMPRVDDIVVLTAAPDPSLVGQSFVVLDVARTQYLTARKMTAQGIQESRTSE